MALNPEGHYEIVFRGELLPGFTLDVVKPALTTLFSAKVEEIQKLFSGKRVVIKTGLDAVAAQKYQQALQKAGLYVEVNPLSAKTASSSSADQADAGQTSDNNALMPLWTIMEVGSLLSDPQQVSPPIIPAPDFTLAEAGSDLGELPRAMQPVQVSITHLSVLPLP
jgi:hypothetical protein